MADSPGTRRTRRRGRTARWSATAAGGLALAALLAVAAPAVAHAEPGADQGKPVIVRLEPGSDPDAQAREAAARGARVTFVYRDVFPGYAAVLPPGGLRGIEGGPGVVAVDPDTPVAAVAGGPARRTPATRCRGGSTGSTSGHGRSRAATRRPPRTGTAAASPPTSSTRGSRPTTTTSAAGCGRASPRSTTGAAPTTAPATARTSPARSAARRAGWRARCRWSRSGPWTATGSGETSGVIAGIDWAARDHRRGTPAVANLSLAGEASDSVDAAIRGLVADGVTVTVAAGNEDADACRSSPGREPSVLTVGATARDDTRAPFSNRGKCVDLFAPGVDIVSDWNTGATSTKELSGTSMASPHVAGAAALLLGADALALARAGHGAAAGRRDDGRGPGRAPRRPGPAALRRVRPRARRRPWS